MSTIISSFTGVDMGTSRIVCARPTGEDVSIRSTLNAYIQVRDTPAARQSFTARRVAYTAVDGVLEIDGAASVPFAQLYNADLLRTMRLGCINSQEPASFDVLTRLVSQLVGEAPSSSSSLVFSVPSPPAGSSVDTPPAAFIHHQMVLKRLFEELGYIANPVAEGESVIYSELKDTGYTGIGISFGAGLVNVAMNYLALPVMAFSMERGGDMIDSSAANVTGDKATRIRLLKESKFAFTNENRDPTSRAIYLFYLDLIDFVVRGLTTAFSELENMPHLDAPIPVVIAGGTTMPNGFLYAFEKALRASDFPLEISEVRQAKDPLNAVALGSLEYARANYNTI